MAVVLYGPSLALSSGLLEKKLNQILVLFIHLIGSSVTPLSITTSILVVGVICTFYTSIVSNSYLINFKILHQS